MSTETLIAHEDVKNGWVDPKKCKIMASELSGTLIKIRGTVFIIRLRERWGGNLECYFRYLSSHSGFRRDLVLDDTHCHIVWPKGTQAVKPQ